jgi:hypothetical protein
VPDPKLPFLGVHLTPMIGGYVTVGPNAVLAMAREGYRRSAVDLKEVAGLLAFPGFWRVMRNHLGSAVTELKNSLWRRGYLAECRKFCPELTLDDLSSYPAGVRAQAVPTRWHPGARLRYPVDETDAPCLQRAVARRDVGHPDRGLPGRPDERGFRSGRGAPTIAPAVE